MTHKPEDIRITIQIENNGYVHFGNFKTENFEFQGDFPKYNPIPLKAIPEKGFRFKNWSMQTGTKGFVFISDQLKTVIKNPQEHILIKAEFEKEM